MISSLKLPLKYVVQMIFVFALTACVQVSSPTEHLSAAPSAQEATEMPTQKPSKTSAPTPTQTPYPFSNPDVKITGEEEVVFDWSVDRCEPENIPDLSTRAFRDASGQVNLINSHYVAYRMVGPDLNNVKIDCDQPIMSSERNLTHPCTMMPPGFLLPTQKMATSFIRWPIWNIKVIHILGSVLRMNTFLVGITR